MGVPNRNDGKIERADLDGGNRKTIIPEGATFTPKQIHLDRKNRKLYWSDREGMRVMRSNLDGSNIDMRPIPYSGVYFFRSRATHASAKFPISMSTSLSVLPEVLRT